MTEVLVVGHGSIGERHRNVLEELGCRVGLVSLRGPYGEQRWADIATALADQSFDYAVVANETSRHASALDALQACGFTGPILVEKPLFACQPPKPYADTDRIKVAYNLRFHPLIEMLQDRVGDQKILGAEIHVGQHLSQWRPGRDYRDTYSAQSALGGGVLRDLSHELDYALLLFGPWQRLTAIGGRSGEIAGDVADQFAILAECARCPNLTLHLNIIDRMPARMIRINTETTTLVADLISGELHASDRDIETVTIDRNHTYRAQHQAMLDGAMSQLCDFDQGCTVVAMIEAIERAAETASWQTP